MSEMKYKIKRGDIWQLGQHKLMCADGTHDDITPLFEGIGEKSKKENDGGKTQSGGIRLILTDPPYGVAYVENKQHFKQKDGETQISVDREIQNDQLQTESEYADFTRKWLNKVTPYLSSYNAIYIFNADLMFCALRQGMKEAKIYYSQMIIWIKNTVVIGRKDYLPQHELIAYGWFGRHKMERSKDKSIILYPKPGKAKLHPTMKPIGLLRKLILNSTKMGDIVFDGFGGSGSTLIACEHTNRTCLMVEIDPLYCDTIVRRWEELGKGKAVKL